MLHRRGQLGLAAALAAALMCACTAPHIADRLGARAADAYSDTWDADDRLRFARTASPPARVLVEDKTIKAVAYNSLPVGTGRFTVVTWQRGRQIELRRNDDYFLGKPKLVSIVFKPIADENREITQLTTLARRLLQGEQPAHIS